MRAYAKKIYEYINKSQKQINTDFGNMKTVHFFSFRTSQFSLPKEETYNKLIEIYEINKMNGFLIYDQMKFERYTYNPQKTEGKAYRNKVKESELNSKLPNYKAKLIQSSNSTGKRFPTSIIKFKPDTEKIHPTQKPILLNEYLINTYSNKGDLVLDFCFGSGSSIIACINTKRNYIGCEKDVNIFNMASERIKNHL